MTLIRRGLMMAASAGGGGMYDLVLRNGQWDSTSLAFYNWVQGLLDNGQTDLSEYNITLIFNDGTRYVVDYIPYYTEDTIYFNYGYSYIDNTGYCNFVVD